jgi:hypothetical protein
MAAQDADGIEADPAGGEVRLCWPPALKFHDSPLFPSRIQYRRAVITGSGVVLAPRRSGIWLLWVVSARRY